MVHNTIMKFILSCILHAYVLKSNLYVWKVINRLYFNDFGSLSPYLMSFCLFFRVFSRFYGFKRMDKGKTMAYSHFVSILMYHLVYLCSFSQLHNITKNSGYNRKYFYITVPPMFRPRKQKVDLKIKLRTMHFWKVHILRCLKNDIPYPVRGGAR